MALNYPTDAPAEPVATTFLNLIQGQLQECRYITREIRDALYEAGFYGPPEPVTDGGKLANVNQETTRSLIQNELVALSDCLTTVRHQLRQVL